jgi:hypothetical protein
MSRDAKLPNAIASLVGAKDSYLLADSFGFVKQFRQFTKLGGTSHKVEPILFERSESAGAANGHYFHQDLLVAKFIHDDAPERHIDIGSRIDGFVAHVAVFRKIEILDVRTLKSTGHPNIEFKTADLMQLDPDFINSTDSISCLHAIEHFGLGRYGDAINPNGHIIGFQNIVNMLKPGGKLYISFPIATQSAIIFNKHRIFSPYDIFAWPTPGCTLKLLRFDYVDDAGEIHQNVNLNTESIIANYGCGIYTFEKFIGDIDCTIDAISKAQTPPQLTFLMDPSNQEGAGSFYQRPFLASLMAQSLGAPFLLAANPHSDCHYQESDHALIEQDWEKVFNFFGPKHQFPGPLQNLNIENQLVAGQTYNAPFDLSYRFLNKLDRSALQILLDKARQRFLENIRQHPELLPEENVGTNAMNEKSKTIIALHLRDRSKGDPPFSTKTLLDWQMFSRNYGLPDNNLDYYSRLYAHAVNQIVEKNHIEMPVLHIHSTGEEKSFQQIISLLHPKISVKLFLNTHPPKSFIDLVFADYLIASHSSFSWLASLLREGPTFIRGKFRHFVTLETQFIEEVLYQNTTWVQKNWIKLNMFLRYQILKWR